MTSPISLNDCASRLFRSMMSFNLLKLVESYVVISVQVSGYVMVKVLITKRNRCCKLISFRYPWANLRARFLDIAFGLCIIQNCTIYFYLSREVCKVISKIYRVTISRFSKGLFAWCPAWCRWNL